jgi:hypothetical protein
MHGDCRNSRPEINCKSDYPDAALVRACVENRLDLPSIRRTLQALPLPIEMAGESETQSLSTLPALEEACRDAFKIANVPVQEDDIMLAAPFLGVGCALARRDTCRSPVRSADASLQS